MRAMILAAGRGERMRPLTDHLPKPLLEVKGKPLLQYHLEALARAGIKQVVVNHSRLGKMIEDYFGDGSNFNIAINYSAEGDAPLETGGGIKNALPLLGDKPFVVVNADIWTNYDFTCLSSEIKALAHLVLVANPVHNPAGDFCLVNNQVSLDENSERLTYSGIGVFSPNLFADCQDRIFPLGPLLRTAAVNGAVTGEAYFGEWLDVGTPLRLRNLESSI